MKLKQRILVSVTNKSFLEQIKRLFDVGWEVVSTGNTATALEGIGVKCTRVEDVTGFPEMMDGRLKTLHPKVFGGILADQHNKEHLQALLDHNIELFGVVAVNLYDFEKNPGIENIDIGGPSLLRAAGKNHTSVAVICDPRDYKKVFDEILENQGTISINTLEDLAIKVFESTTKYDTMIRNWMIERRRIGLHLKEDNPFAGH